MVIQRHTISTISKIYNSSGILVYEGPGVDMFVNSLSIESKISVDEGSFVPGEFRINPYHHERTSYVAGVGSFERVVTQKNGSYARHTSTGPYALWVRSSTFDKPFYSSSEGQKKLALQKAMSKVGDSDLELGTELGELGETLKMLRSPFKSLRNLLNKDKQRLLQDLIRFEKEIIPRLTARKSEIVRKLAQKATLKDRIAFRKRALALDDVQSIAGAWLEFRYGVMPLVNSIRSIADYVSEKAKKIDFDVIRSCGSRLTDSDQLTSTVKSPQEDMGGWTPTFDVSSRTTRVVRAKVYYKRRYESSNLQKLGLSLEYLPEIALELTRLSFVLDWIVSVGPWLGSYRVKPGIEILGNTVSERLSTYGEAIPNFRPNVANLKITYSGSIAVFRKEYYDRVIDQSLPVLPQFRWDDAVSLLHTVDSLALILQPIIHRLKRRK